MTDYTAFGDQMARMGRHRAGDDFKTPPDPPRRSVAAPVKRAYRKLVPETEPKWLTLARADIGIHEIKGPQHNERVLAYYADAGFPGIDNDETAWCAAFVNAQLERSGFSGSKSLMARDFLRWGKPVAKPYPGAIAVFKRGNSTWQGHVGFYINENETHIEVLGGNQDDQVKISWLQKSKLLGYREPMKAMNSRTVRANAAGAFGNGSVGTGFALKALSESSGDILAVSDLLQTLGQYWAWFIVIGVLLSVGAHCISIQARISDWRNKGR